MSDTNSFLYSMIKIADAHYGKLDSTIVAATTPQELVDGLSGALNTLREWQLKAQIQSDARSLALRITCITSFIDQVKCMFEGDIK